jgi:hypothetical protein
MLAGEQLPAAAAVLAMVVGDEPVVPDVRAAAAVAGSLALGWLVFGRHLATVLQVDDAASFEAAVAAEIGAAMARPRRRAARSGA